MATDDIPALERDLDRVFEQRRQAEAELRQAEGHYNDFAHVLDGPGYPENLIEKAQRAKAALPPLRKHLKVLDDAIAKARDGLAEARARFDPLAGLRDQRPEPFYFAHHAELLLGQARAYFERAADLLREAHGEETCLARTLNTPRAHNALSLDAFRHRVQDAIAPLFEAYPEEGGERGKRVVVKIEGAHGMRMSTRPLEDTARAHYEALIAETAITLVSDA